MKKVLRFAAYILFVILAIGFVVFWPSKQDINKNWGHPWENYDPSLFHKIQNTDDLVRLADDSLGKANRQTLGYVRFLNNTISHRFYHGYSTYTFHQNWLSYLAGNLVWEDLNAVVIPDDILKYPNAACSQVSIVLADALKEIGVPYRKVGLKGHFALEANVGGKWHFFDANLEPHFPKGGKSLQELIRDNELYAGYEVHLAKERVTDVFSDIQYGQPNEDLASNATLFHRGTYWASLLIAFGLLAFIVIDLTKTILYKRRRQIELRKVKESQQVSKFEESNTTLHT